MSQLSNRQRTMYEYYIKAIERNLKKNELGITPMSELIEQKAFDDFEAQYKMPVEYIQRADRCLADLNKQIMEELAKQTESEEVEQKDSNIYFGSGYNGPKTLTFYNDKNTGEMWSRIEGADLNFINFAEAYQFIKTNKIPVYNISMGSWQKEIQEYERSK